MVTNAVNMDLKVGAANGAKRMDADTGFSDVLGNVSSGNNRRQPGLSDSSRKDFGKELGKQFNYTKKASETTHEVRETGDGGMQIREPGQVKGGMPADGVSMRSQQTVRDDATLEEADKLLSDAVEIVAVEVAQTGEVPTKHEAAEMMADALKGMAVVPEKAEAPEVPVMTEEPEELPVPVLTEETDVFAMPGSEEENTKPEAMPAPAIPKNDEQPAVPAAEARNELIYALADAIVSAADAPEESRTADAPAEEEDAPTVHVITPDSSFLMTEKHVEAAMLTGLDEQVRNTEPDDNGEAFRAELSSLISSEGDEEYIPTGYTADDDEYSFYFEEAAKTMFTGGRADLHSTGNEVYADRSTLIEKVLAKLRNVTVEEGGEPVAEMEVVKDTAKMLGEMIDRAKKELGLTETSYEHSTGETDLAAPLMQDEPVKLSRSLNRSDRTEELDHILGSGRADAVKEDENAPKTETYDAVHMAAHLMNDRTGTDIPVEKLQERADAAEVRPPEIQTAEQIIERIRTMQDDHMEFTMVLNPESLGRITVKLVMAGERTAVEINAENPETRAILAARSANLQTMLRDNGVELESYQVVSEHEDAQFLHQNYEGSSKNPYSRNDSGEDEKHEDEEDGESFYDLLGQI